MTIKKKIGIGIVVLALVGIALKWNSIQWAYYEFRLLKIKRELFALEQQGKPYRPAHQILYETEWLGSATHDLHRVGERLQALEDALKDTANALAADEQSETEGSWGKWYTEWFFKLDASYDQIAELARQGKVPKYPVHFLDCINSPAKLTTHLNHLLISDPKGEGINHRRELNETISDLMRLILRAQPQNYTYDPKLKDTLMDWLINTARNPETGYWGAWYRQSGSGKIKKTDDLSITFHIVSYLQGNVPDWQKIIATTLAIKDKDYPLGWLENGRYLNHNNMDVVQIFKLGWRQASPEQQEAMSVEIRKMLNWCLTESLQPDGSFKLQDSDDSQETNVAFGADFLARLGFFDKSKRFWSNEEFPEAENIRQRIIQFIRSHINTGSEGGFYYHNTLKELGAAEDSK